MKGMQGSIRRQPSSSLNFAGVRRYPRTELNVEVLIQDDDGWEFPVESLDFSPTGMFVRTNFLFEVGTIHNLIFRSPDGDALFSIRGQVVRVENDAADDDEAFVPGMAYEFMELTADHRQRLKGLAARV